ncbi:amidohydrolase [Leucobacter sp. NPDC015123]|uniref:amidohydrolase n=1 Tax=Leucobacter sp. NPDC015123 TaxID=3364129 RepID=UPI0036F45772
MAITVFTGGAVIVAADRVGAVDTASAIAFEDGRVIALDAEALELAANATSDVIDLAGGTLVPGIGEGHAHPVLGGLEAVGPNVREAVDLAGILSAVAEWKQQHPEADWIVGASYDATFAPGGVFRAEWLDEVTGDTPTILRAWDYHTAWVNSAALRAGGITAETPDPELGRYVRDADGTPTGTLQEAAANDFIANVVPAFSIEDRVAAIEAATLSYAEQGTTWVQDAWVEPTDLPTYLEAARADRLHTRVNLAFRADPATWQSQVAAFEKQRDQVRSLAHDRLSADTVKFFVDGVIENHTAVLAAPYADRPDERGLPNWAEDELISAARAFDLAGFQLHIHAIGDDANRIALDTIAAVQAENPTRERAHVVAHVAMLAQDQVGRFAELDVIANFEPYWAQCDAVMRDLTIPHIGHDREGWQYLIGSVLRAGATVSFGSDWPVTTKDWRPAFSTAVTRHSHLEPDAAAWLPDERVSAAAALSAYTAGTARQALASDRGTLHVGMVADAVWLSADPLSVDPNTIPSIDVRGTWLAGERTY